MSIDDIQMRGQAPGVEAHAHFDTKPRLEIYRSTKGAYSWRICVVAADQSAYELRHARDLALEIDADLGHRLPMEPKS